MSDPRHRAGRHTIRRPFHGRRACQRPSAFTTQEEGGALVVEVFGQLDLATSPQLHQRLMAALDEYTERLVVDLSGLDFIDVTGIRALMDINNRSNGRLLLLRGPERVHRVFRLVGLDTVLPFAD